MSELDFKHFPSIKRLPLGQEVKCKPETVMSINDAQKIFNGQRLIIEEKFNGTAKMFLADNGRFTILAEDMLRFKPGLTGLYLIPSRYAIWDIFDNSRKVFVSFVEKEDIFRSIKRKKISVKEKNESNFFLATVLGQGCTFKLEDMPLFIDMYSKYIVNIQNNSPDFMEGIVIKPAREMFFPEYEILVGKLIRNEYFYGENKIEKNYLKMPIKYNKINPKYGINDPNFNERKTNLNS